MVCAVAVAAVSFRGGAVVSPQVGQQCRSTGWAMTVAAGIAGFFATTIAGTTDNKTNPADNSGLKSFEAIQKSNFNARLYSEMNSWTGVFVQRDGSCYLGLLWRRNARPRLEQAKEELQRQVIRLLNDVEGAARSGDLTRCRPRVSADVLKRGRLD